MFLIKDKKPKLLLSILLAIIFIALFPHKVKAESFSVLSPKEVININEDNNGNINISFQIQNNNPTDIVGGYEFNLPYLNIQNVIATIDGSQVEVNKTEITDKNLTNLGLTFGNSVIKPGETKTLSLYFDVLGLVTAKNKLKYFYVYKIQYPDRSLKSTTEINYPKSFGEPSFMTNLDYTLDDSLESKIKITSNNLRSFLMMWGDEYYIDIQSDYQITQKTANSENTLINLIEENKDQEVSYEEIKEGRYGLYDKSGNNFYLSQNNPNTTVGFSARILKKNSNENSDYPKNYDIGFDPNLALTAQIYHEMEQASSSKDKLRNVNNFLIANFTPASDKDSFDINTLDDLQKNVEVNKENISSFEYSYFMMLSAENLGLQVKMKYGYVVFPNLSNNVFKPHFWIEIKTDNEEFIADPYLTDLIDIDYFGVENSLDRIAFGTWYPDDDYNPVLGMFSKESEHPEIKVTDLKDFAVGSNEIDVDINSKNSINSGFFSDLELSIFNATNNLLKIQEIKIDGISALKNIRLNEDLYASLLPLSQNEIPITNFREPNFVKAGIKNVDIEIQFSDKNEFDLTSKELLNYKPNSKVIITLVVGFNLAVVISLIILWLKHLRHKVH